MKLKNLYSYALEMFAFCTLRSPYKIVKRAFLLAVNSIIQTSPELILKR